MGEPITDLIVPAYDTEAAASVTATVKTGTELAGEYACCRKDGTEIWIHSMISPIVEHGQVVAVVGSFIDISKRRASDIRIGSLLRHASNVAFVVNADGTFKYVAPDFERAFGLERRTLIGQLGYDFVHPNDRSQVAHAIAVAVADPDEHPVVVYRGRTDDGTWGWRELIATNMLDEPAVGGIVLNVRDVSEREEAVSRAPQQRGTVPLAVRACERCRVPDRHGRSHPLRDPVAARHPRVPAGRGRRVPNLGLIRGRGQRDFRFSPRVGAGGPQCSGRLHRNAARR